MNTYRPGKHTHTHTHTYTCMYICADIHTCIYIYIYIHIYIHTHNGIISAIKKNEIFPFAITWMELQSILLREINQSEKDKYPMTSLTCGI